MLNEFSSKKYNVCVIPDADPCPPGVGTIEEIALNNFDIDLSDAWIWISMVSWFESLCFKEVCCCCCCNDTYTVQNGWDVTQCFILSSS